MEKIVRNYLEIKSLDELLVEKKPNDNCSLEQVSSTDFQLNKHSKILCIQKNKSSKILFQCAFILFSKIILLHCPIACE